MGSLIANSYDEDNQPIQFRHSDTGGRNRIYTLDPSEPFRSVDPDPNPPPVIPPILFGLAALGLGYWAKRRSAELNSLGASLAPSADELSKALVQNQRRVSGLNDEINGGQGSRIEDFPATRSRTAQLAGIPDGDLSLGRQTQFPPIDSPYSGGLPAVLRGAGMGHNQGQTHWQNSTNDSARGWQAEVRPLPSDDLDIPDFLRRTAEPKDIAPAPVEREIPAAKNSGGGSVGGNGGGGGGDGGKDDGCDEEIRRARQICIDAFADGWNGNYSAWRSNYRVGPYKKSSGGRWTIQDCMKGLVRKDCGGEDPDDPENQKKYAWPPRPRRSR